MLTHRVPWLGAVLIFMASTTVVSSSDFDVIINEVHYHPISGEAGDEFIELFNRGPTPVDLAGWGFIEGVTFIFPSTYILEPGAYVVVSPDAARTEALYGIEGVVGNFTGRLDNSGEILTLVNARGAEVNRIHFLDSTPWPSNPDGLGPTLELVSPHEPNDLPQKWVSSLVLDGTPGSRNTRYVELQMTARTILAQGDIWRYAKGSAGEPSNPMTRWTERGFVDAGWSQGPGPVGVGTIYTVGTELDDLVGSYTTAYLRRLFDVDPQTLADIRAARLSLTLHVVYDDGFVAYLNGVEVGRQNYGTPGVPVPFDAPADSRLDNGSSAINIDTWADLLLPTGNVLALQGANGSLTSGDFLLGGELIVSSAPVSFDEVVPTVVLNEVRPTEPGIQGFIELYNRTDAALDLGGYVIVGSAGGRAVLPQGTSIGARGLLAFLEGALGFAPSLAGRYVLLESDGRTWLDCLNPTAAPAGASFGRYPDGNEDAYVLTTPTRGTPNALTLEGNVILNEILYHPAFVPPSGNCLRQCSDVDQWIELHNRGAAKVALGGWSLTKGVEFSFPEGAEIPAGGYVVVAADPARFRAAYPAVAPAFVFGPWTQSLARDSDTINLRDALGNRVDHVKYGDGGPINDEEPLDGIDDRTIASSEWPPGADDGAQGRSLELIHPALDNRAGAAWRASPEPASGNGGSPGAANAAFDATPAPVVWDVAHSPTVPRTGETVQVTCRVSSVVALTRVDLIWQIDPEGAPTTVQLHDDGLSGDGAAGDGTFGATIPPQPLGAVVAFRVSARTGDGQVALVPRAPEVPPYAGAPGPSFLYQVDDSIPPANGSVTYRVILAAADLEELASRPVTSNVLLPCTFVADDKAWHHLGIRIRGENSRYDDRKAWRIDFPAERKFEATEHLNLLASEIAQEILAADLFRRSALPYMQEWTVNLVFQGVLDPMYVAKENFDGDFLDRYFGGSSDGNLYRAVDPAPPGGSPQGDLSYEGPFSDPAAEEIYRQVYDKKTNREEDDFSDVVELCLAFDTVETPDDQFVARIAALIDANQWARFFAVQACLSNVDGGIYTNSGEDYLLYRVPADSPRADHGRWLLLPWDIGETFQNASERLFRPDVAAIRRFLTHPAFAPLYYANLLDLRDGAFSRFETRQRFVLIDDLYGFGTIDQIDSYITARIGFFDENIPILLTAGVVSSGNSGLVLAGDVWKYFKGTAEPSGGNVNWTRRTGFDDSGWLSGPTGIGYGDGDDATELDDMEGNYSTVYLRKAFQVANPAALSTFELHIDYDDGFVAYLNGQEVTRRSAPGAAASFVPFDETATGSGREAGTPEVIDLASSRGLLVSGTNVLAIQVLNSAVDSSDLSCIPELVTGQAATGAGCGDILYATGDSVTLSGLANGAETASVRVNGDLAAFDGYRARWTATVPIVAGANAVRVETFDAIGFPAASLDLTVIRIGGAFTQVSGTLGGNTAWTKAASPYLLTANVTVPAGVKLTIEPGAFILGQPDASIIVRGVLEALGTEAEPIRFRGASCVNRMGGIAFDGTGVAAASPEHRLRYCDFESAHNPAGFLGVVALVGAKLLVEDSSFKDLTANAIDGTDSRLEVRRSRFERIHEGVHCTRSMVLVLDNVFQRMVGDKDAVDFDLNGASGERSRIERNLFEDSSDDGIDLQATSVDIRDNVFRRISDKALSLEEDGPVGHPTVTGNLIIECGTGLALKSGVVVEECFHNTVVSCQEGINLFAKAGASDGGHGVFDSLILWHNIFDVKVDALSTAAFSYSDIEDGLWPGVGNLSADPRFVDPLGGDYSLGAGSPAIGAGKDSSDMGAIPFTGVVVRFIRGDVNADGQVQISDPISTLDYLFRGGVGPTCIDRIDANDDGLADISDAIYVLFFLFTGGEAPPAPFPAEGLDPTPDGLECF